MDSYPTPRQVMCLSLVAFMLAQVVVFPLLAAYSARLGLVGAQFAVLSVAALFIRRHRMVPEDLFLLNATSWRALLLALPMAAAAGVLVEQIDLWFVEALAFLGYHVPLALQRQLLELQLVRSLPEMGLALVAVAVVPAVCEEAFFRGVVFTSLCARRGPRAAVFGSAALFALAHFNPWHLPALLILGLFLALLVYWTHSVYPAILAHLSNNLLSIADVNLQAYTGIELVSPTYRGSLVLLAAGALVAGLLLLRRQPPVMPLPSGNKVRPDSLGFEAAG